MTSLDAAIFDVDGTLFDYRDHKIHASSVDAVNTLRSKGVTIIIASGRSYGLLGEECLSKISADYYVLANGHSVMDGRGNSMLTHRFSREETQLVVDSAVRHGAGLMLKYPSYSCIYSSYEEMFAVFAGIGLGHERFLYCPTMDRHLTQLPIGATLKGNPETARIMEQELCGLRVELFHDITEFDVFKPRLNKMTGLRYLFRRLGIYSERCVAFGDSRNDLEMLAGVGEGVAMGNACEELKKVARSVCPPSWEDGIAVALRGMNAI